MIQRIQTVYLFLIFCLMIGILFLPINNIPYAWWLSTIGAPIVMLVAILSGITIFLFKKRKVQIKLCYLIMCFLILCLGIIIFCIVSIPSNYPFKDLEQSYPVIILLIAIILDFLAIRGIKKDEKLVRSANRLRG